MKRLERKSSMTSQIVAACVTAVGIASVWFVFMVWFGSLVTSVLSPHKNLYETVTVAYDGTPVINTFTDYLLTGRRTLDGQPRPVGDEEWLTAGNLPAPYRPPGILETPHPWNRWPGRIAGETDGKQTPTAWYVVRDNEETGGVYLAGFDSRTQQCVGYMGRDGFQATKPAASGEFRVPKTTQQDGLESVAAGHGLRPFQLVPSQQILEDIPAYWKIFLLETDRVCCIDLRQRTVKVNARVENAVAMTTIDTSKATFDQLPIEESKFEPLTEAEKEVEKTLTDLLKKNDHDPAKRFGLQFVRESDRLVAKDFYIHKWKEFILPESLRDRGFTAYLIGPDEILLWVDGRFDENWSGGPLSHLVWINSHGQVQREEELQLSGEVSMSLAAVAWRGTVCVPMPVVWVGGFFGGAPAFLLQSNLFIDFAGAFRYTACNTWLPLVVVLVVGLACAGIAMRVQRKYRRPNAVAWAIFAFLLGPAGLLAYLIEHRRAKLDACIKCGEVVPTNRNACAACQTGFAPPARVGTEIFA